MALGRSSVTVPENSMTSSFGMQSPESGLRADWAGNWAEPPGRSRGNGRSMAHLGHCRAYRWRKTRLDAADQAVAHVPVGGEPGLARALDDRRIEHRPILDLAGHDPGHLQRPVM